MSCPCTPMWLTVLAALLTPTIAVFGAVIAYRQSTTARNKLKLDLFERRDVVYRATRDVLALGALMGRIDDEDLTKFIQGSSGAQWLFGPEVTYYLDGPLMVMIEKLRTANAQMQATEPSQRLVEQYEAVRKLVKWFDVEQRELDAKFAKYLALRH